MSLKSKMLSILLIICLLLNIFTPIILAYEKYNNIERNDIISDGIDENEMISNDVENSEIISNNIIENDNIIGETVENNDIIEEDIKNKGNYIEYKENNTNNNVEKKEDNEVEDTENLIMPLSVESNLKNSTISYKSHVQNIGWQDWKKDGELSGTEGMSLRLEAINIKLNEELDFKIKYQAHIQNIGWQNWKYDGDLAGTEGQKLRLEAIKIELENTENYSIMYRVHVQNIGWQDWKYDGEIAGTEGKSLRIEAIEIKVVKKRIKSILTIDTNLNNATFDKYGIHIDGWKLATVSNTKLRVYIDDAEIDDNYIKYKYKYNLISIVKGYGTYVENPEPNFDIDIPIENISQGNHTIRIELLAPDETILQKQQNNIYIDKSVKSILNIDTVLNGQTFGRDGIHIEGWKLATEPDTKLNVYLNNVKIDEKYIKYSYKYNLTSIVKGYGDANDNPKPNFDIDIPKEEVDDGTYTLKIEFTNSDGSIVFKRVQETIYMKKEYKGIDVSQFQRNYQLECS